MESLEKLGCKLNNISLDELFLAYQKLGFIYPQKRSQIEQYLPEIKINWLKALTAKNALIRILTHTTGGQKSFASVCYWPSTYSGAFVQHAVSAGNPISSRAVLLGVLSAIYHDNHPYRALVNYFRTTNKWAMKLFAKHYNVLGSKDCSLNKLFYLKLHKNQLIKNLFSDIEISDHTNLNRTALLNLAKEIRGNAYAISEDLDRPNLCFAELDNDFSKNGLFLKQAFYLASQRKISASLAALITHRAPLGFNLSFLENRCDILVKKMINKEQVKDIIDQFLPLIISIYHDIELPYVPVLTDESTGRLLITHYSAEFIKEYMQCIWLKDRFFDSYHYIETVYEKVFDRYKKNLIKN